MRYQFIQGQTQNFPTKVLCQVMHVSGSGFYAWRGRPECQRSREDRRLLAHIKSVFQASDKTYGSPRIHRDLNEEGITCGKRRVARLMRQNGIRPEPVKRFVITTASKHALPIHENVLGQQFEAGAADRRWAADITYVWTRRVPSRSSRYVAGCGLTRSPEKRSKASLLNLLFVSCKGAVHGSS